MPKLSRILRNQLSTHQGPNLPISHEYPMESTKTDNATSQDSRTVVHCACGTENPSGRKFCTHCGASLAEQCFYCGGMTMADESFCGGCGAELAGMVQQQTEQFKMDLLKADQLQVEGHLDEAATLLVPIAKLTHTRLLRHAAEAKRKIHQITLLRGRAMAETGPALEEGRKRMAAQDYAGAVKVIQDIPVSLRGVEITALFDQAFARHGEMTTLGSTLREAIAKKQYAGLLKVVSRLLELQPWHADALTVGSQLQKKYCRAAEEMLGQHQYEQALKVTEQIPRPLWTADTAELLQRVSDRAWLATTLRTAAVIDPVLVAAGRRAAELMPDDPGIAKLTKELQKRVKISEKDGGIALRSWAALPAESPLGIPLEWKADFQRIDLSEQCDRQTLVEGRGCYGVACGLALQGLGLAALEMDLRPKATGGVVDFVSNIVRRRRARVTWGIDVGSSSLKAVKLVPGEKGGKPRLEVAMRIEHQKSLGQANNDEEEQALLGETLTTLLARHDLKGDYVVVGLPGKIVITRLFKLPPSDKKKLEAMVQHEVQRHIPVSIDKLVWDYATLDPEGAGEGVPSTKQTKATNGMAIPEGKTINRSKNLTGHKKSWSVLVTAARRSLVERRLAVLEKLGLKPNGVQSEETALYNLFAYELGAEGPEPVPQAASIKNGSVQKDPPAGAGTANTKRWGNPLATPIAVVDLGHEGSRLLLCSPNELSVRNLGFGGQLLTRALVKELNLTMTQAERYKRDPLSAPSVAHIYRTAGPVMEDLLRELQLALNTAANTEGIPPVQQIYLLGGAVQFHGLLRFLQSGK